MWPRGRSGRRSPSRATRATWCRRPPRPRRQASAPSACRATRSGGTGLPDGYVAKSLYCMLMALRASGLWLRYAAQQNLIPSFPWIAPGWRTWEGNPRKGRDQILPSGNPRYTSLDGATEYASTPKCSNMKFCPVCTESLREPWHFIPNYPLCNSLSWIFVQYHYAIY